MANLALAFDDVSIIPRYSDILPSETNVEAKLTNTISINIPILSAAMDTVTESAMAIAMAQNGGIGIIHRNLDVEKQTQEVIRVKKFEGGIVTNPVTIEPTFTVEQVNKIMDKTGFSSFPVIIRQSEIIGLVTARDLRFQKDQTKLIGDIMTPLDKLWCVDESMSRDDMLDLMYKRKVERLPIVRYESERADRATLVGLITLKDSLLTRDFPNAARDPSGKLLVGAAVGVGRYTALRVESLIEAGVDVIVVDTAHGHSKGVLDTVSLIKKFFPEMQVIAGNVVTVQGALALENAGADAVKVGIGPGSICTTRIVSGVGIPQFSALEEISLEVRVPIICDGGIRYSGDIVKAIVAGADTVMLGGLLAGTEEAPGELELYQGRSYKSYRGMGSIAAMAQKNGSSDRYSQSGIESDKLVPEGIEGRVPYRGKVSAVLHQLVGGLRSGMGYVGASDLLELHHFTDYVQVTSSGQIESHPHNVQIIRSAPNYSGDF
jgi:IMP dehydrogenase